MPVHGQRWALAAVAAFVLIVPGGTAALAAASDPPVNTELPGIGGLARVGEVLTASAGSWSGSEPIAYAYQWRRCTSGGGSYRLDGDDWFAGAAPAGIGRPLTLAVWAKADPDLPPGASPLHLEGAWHGDFDHRHYYLLSHKILPDRMGATYLGGNGKTAIEGATHTAGEWVSYVAVFNSNTDLRLYVDGVEYRNGEQSFQPPLDPMILTELGRFRTEGAGGEYRYWNGKIAQALVWDRALTAAEAAQWRTGTIVQPGNVQAHYDLTQAHTSSVPDLSGNGNHLAVNGATYDPDDSPPIGGCTDIEGATSPTYTATSSDLGHTLRIHVTASNNAGSATAISSSTQPVD